MTVILAAVGRRHARRENWCSGWVSGPLAIITALAAASYAASGLPALAGASPGARDPRTLVVEVAVALLAGVLVAVAAWPVAVHVSAREGSPTTLADLREWVIQGDRLYAAGGAALGAAVAWIVLGPLLCVAGAVLGLLVAVTVVTLRTASTPAAPAAPPGQPHPPVVPPRAPAPPAAVSDEDW